MPLKKDLEKHLGVPVFVENDCNIARAGRPCRRTQSPSRATSSASSSAPASAAA